MPTGRADGPPKWRRLPAALAFLGWLMLVGVAVFRGGSWLLVLLETVVMVVVVARTLHVERRTR